MVLVRLVITKTTFTVHENREALYEQPIGFAGLVIWFTKPIIPATDGDLIAPK